MSNSTLNLRNGQVPIYVHSELIRFQRDPVHRGGLATISVWQDHASCRLRHEWNIKETKDRRKTVGLNLKAFRYSAVFSMNDQSIPHEDQPVELLQSPQ